MNVEEAILTRRSVRRFLPKPVPEPVVRKIIEVSARSPSGHNIQPSFVEHLKMLEGAGLVRSQKAGRVRTYELVPEQLLVVDDWLRRQRTLWEGRLDRLDAYLLAKKKERPG